MTTLVEIPWKIGIDWAKNVQAVLQYYKDNPKLKYGPAQGGKAVELIERLCALDCASRTHLLETFRLGTPDAIATILSNVTMAIQGSGSVLPPESGGWYVTVVKPRIYIVAPEFSAAWKEHHSELMN